MTDPTREQIAEMAALVADRSIREEGFLSPMIDVYAEAMVEANKHVFDVATKLNQIVFAGWQQSPNEGRGDDFEPVMNRLMLRAMHAFAGAIVLARRGMDAESQMISRSIFECAFWLGWMRTNPDQALADFKLDSERGIAQHKRAMAEVVPETVPADELERLAAFLKATKNTPGAKKLAEDSGMASAYVYYKALCGLAGHSTMSSIDRYLVDDGSGTLGHEINVSGDGIPETVGYAAFGLCAAYSQFGQMTRARVEIDGIVPILKEIEAMLADHVDPEAASTSRAV